MVFDLILDVINGFWQLGDTHTESAITFFSLAPNLGRDPFNRPARCHGVVRLPDMRQPDI